MTVVDSLYELTEIKGSDSSDDMLITGNEATALGFAVAGGKFYAGYPITPSTEVMEWLIPWLPKFGGVVKQAEDELSAINMAIGARADRNPYDDCYMRARHSPYAGRDWAVGYG